MARPVYPHELCDPDFAWLLSSYREEHPNLIVVESTFLPIVLIPVEEKRDSDNPLPLADELETKGQGRR